MFTSANWRWDEQRLPDYSSPTLQHLTAATTGVILVQLVLGSVYRHAGSGITPHLIGACVVALLVVSVIARILANLSSQRGIRQPAQVLAALLVIQVVLGIYSYILKTASHSAAHPIHSAVAITTVHVAVGALILVTSLRLAYQTHRFLSTQTGEARVPSAPHSATI